MSESAFRPGCYAAIDIGTVTCRLLVADVDEAGSLQEVTRDMAITNLGTGVDASGRLAPDAIERVGATIDDFAEKIEKLQEGGSQIHVRAIATSASRDATNSEELVARLRQAGIELDIIPGTTEASLSFSGATSAFPGQKAVVIDVGGGSTEIIGGQAGGEPALVHSFQVGCRRVTERFFVEDPPTDEMVEEAAAWVANELQDYIDRLRAGGFLDERIIAVAGTATSVVSMREKMTVYDSSRVHKAVISESDLDELIARVQPMTLAERQEIVGLNPQRAPVILAGMVILRQIMKTACTPSLTISECDILDGIILDAARRK